MTKLYPTDNEIRKEFEERFGEDEGWYPSDFLITTRSNDRKAIVEMVEGMKQELVTDDMPPLNYAYNKALDTIIKKLTELG